MKELLKDFDYFLEEIKDFSIDDKIEFINQIKLKLHSISPLKNEPVDCVLWVKNNMVHANSYNPNTVAPPEMKLLELSIAEDGYTQPIVTMLEEEGTREVIDGFHRNRVGKESEMIQKRVLGYLPVVSINNDRKDESDRMAATVRHNRARGKHSVDSMSDIIMALKKRKWSDEKIGNHLGMDPDEVLRLSQITGLADMFADKEFSQAWEADDLDESYSMNFDNKTEQDEND